MVVVATVAMAMVFTGPAGASPAWLAPTTLSVPSATASEGAEVAGDPAGNAVAVWTRVAGDAVCCTIVQAAVHIAGGGWSAPRDLSTAGANAHTPQVKLDESGNALVVWAQDSPNGTVIRYRTRPANGDFSAPASLSEAEAGHDASSPQVAVNARGAAAVVWLRQGDTAVVVQAATRDTATQAFGLPRQLSDPSVNVDAYGAQVGVDAAGDVVATWGGAAAPQTNSSVRPAGGDWTAPTSFGPGYDVQLAVGADGRAVAFWTVGNDEGWVAWRSASPTFAAGTWGAPSPVFGHNVFGPSVFRPQVTLDADGTALLTYLFLDVPYPHIGALAIPTPGTVTVMSDYGFRDREPSGVAAGPRGGIMVYWILNGAIGSRVRPLGGLFEPIRESPRSGGSLKGQLGVALDDEGNGVAVWQEESASGGFTIRTAGYDAAPPVFADVAVPASVPVGATVGLTAGATDRWSGVTYKWHYSDESAADGSTVSHTFTVPGTEQVTVTASDASGNAVTTTRTVEVLATPPEATRPAPDADGDGIPDEQDCDDANAAISPIAHELPGNAVDENCDGRRDPYPTVRATVQLTTQLQSNRSTRLLRLTVRGTTAGDEVRLHCTGRGCRKSLNRTIKARAGRPTLTLTKYVTGVRLRPGARLEVRVAHAQQISRVYTFVMRASKSGAPRQVRRCQAPGEKVLKSC